MTPDQQLLSYIVTTLVDNPDDVTIERSIDERGVLLQLTVNPSDLGRIIGRQGSTAKAMRALLHILSARNNASYNLRITNNGENFNQSYDNDF